MKAPKCPVCGVSEWRHLCGNAVLEKLPRPIREHFDVQPTALQIGVTKTPVTKTPVTKKGGRPKKVSVLSAAERKRRSRERMKEKGGE